ncbi:DNA translocase FtsK [Pontiella sp.]|uniref:DNA translocase FtsK n=1 Tax=Pontiella sp. TaxID=2837462 RepID=UPI00356B2FA3
MQEIENHIKILGELFERFEVKAWITAVEVLSDYTSFEVLQGDGIDVEDICRLSDDIALALGASHIEFLTEEREDGTFQIKVY